VTNTEPLVIAGRYRLVSALATGGMGVVWKGWDERLHRPVAIKQVRLQPGLSESETTTARNRAMREARNTARLHHPHAVPVYDVVEHDGEPCIIMEFLPSISLQESIRDRGTLPAPEVARIGSEVAKALAAAHRAGIVHRDVKPGNVLLAEDGTTKLTDFGISHAIGDTALTQTGMLTGTPAYLAPEVARGEPATFASDVFSLGSTLYSATEGVPPFGKDDNAMAVLHRVASGQHPRPQRSGPLTPLLTRMLTTDPRQRPTMNEVSRALAAVHAESSAADTASSAPARLETVQLDKGRRAPDKPKAAPLPEPPTAAPPEPPPPEPLVALPESASAAPEPPVDPPSTVLDTWLASGGAPPRERRGSRGLIAALLAGALVIAAVIVAIALANRKDPNPAAGGAPTTSVTHPTSPATHPSSPAATTSQRQSSSPSQKTSVTNPATTPITQPGGSAAQLAQAVTDYYGLLPGNVQQAWSRLTPAYQNSTEPNGFADYQQFWSQFSQVAISGVTAKAPNHVEATITYVGKNGSRNEERRSFDLVRSGGQWKINASAVL